MYSNAGLAHQEGLSFGRQHGIAEGMEIGYQNGRNQGYNEGWSQAVHEANGVINECNATIRSQRQQLEALEARAQQLQAEVVRLNAELEESKKRFIGAAAIIQPAMKMIAKLPFEDQLEVLDGYGAMVFKNLGHPYVDQYNFPHNQEIFLNMTPTAKAVFHSTATKKKAQIAAEKERALQQEQELSPAT